MTEIDALKYGLEEIRKSFDKLHEKYIELLKQQGEVEKENKELQERNDRQYKQLGDLYRLIEEKDWRALTDIMDDFKKADEQLQKEWKCYE